MTISGLALTMTKPFCDPRHLACPQLMTAVLDMCSDAIAIVQNGQILYANPSFSQTNGLSPGAELRGCLLRDLIPEQHDSTKSNFTLTRGEHFIKVSTSIFTEKQQEFHIVKLCRTLQMRSRRDRVDAPNTAFTTELWVHFAHRFNNLLTRIILCSDLLVWELESNCGLRHHAETIQESGLDGAKMIRQITTQSNNEQLATAWSWNQVVSEMVSTLITLVGPNIQVKTELAEPMALARMPATQAYRIILALVLDAQHAMPEGGVITISTQGCGIFPDSVTKPNPLTPNGPFVISDTGMGIDTETLAQILHGTLREGSSVRPLGGWRMARNIVKRAGGKIEIESKIGVGTAVTIRMPVVGH